MSTAVVIDELANAQSLLLNASIHENTKGAIAKSICQKIIGLEECELTAAAQLVSAIEASPLPAEFANPLVAAIDTRLTNGMASSSKWIANKNGPQKLVHITNYLTRNDWVGVGRANAPPSSGTSVGSGPPGPG